MDFRFRNGEAEDIDFLWEMLYQAIYVADGKPKPSRSILEEPTIKLIMDGWGRKGDMAFVAIDSTDNPIGAVWMRLFNEKNSTHGFIDEATPILGIAVLPEYRGKGIGTKLMKEIMKESKKIGYKQVSLSVDRDNYAFDLYKSIGFIPVELKGTSWDMVCIL